MESLNNNSKQEAPLKISVVTVCYNAVNTIEETMLSVLNQTYPNVEYIVIDGGSTDGTVDIIKKYADRLAYWTSEPDKGIYDAMNKGIDAATGDYINFMNSGDTFYTVRTIQEVFDDHKDPAIVYGYILRQFDKRVDIEEGITEDAPNLVDFINNTIHHQAAFMKKDLFKKYGKYDTNYTLASDWIFFLKCVAFGNEKIQYKKMPISIFRMNGVSTKHKAQYKEECIDFISTAIVGISYEELEELQQYKSYAIVRKIVRGIYLAKHNKIYQSLRINQFGTKIRNTIKRMK